MEISIVITNYNYEKYLARSIRSAINQSFLASEFEIIVVDDFSQDNSKTIIESFSGNIISIFNQTHLGLAASCNEAAKHARGKYIIRLDADDFFHKDCLKVHHLFLSNNKEMDATSCDYLEVDERESIIQRKCGSTWPIACGILYRLDQMIELGLYDETLPREDFEFRKRFLNAKYSIYNIAIPLYRYTVHSGSLSRSK